MLDIENNINKIKIKMFKRLSQKQKKLILNIQNIPKETIWHNQKKNLANKYNIDMDKDKYTFKRELKAKINETFTIKLTQKYKNKCKITFPTKKTLPKKTKA